MGAPLSGKSLGNFEGSTGNATSEFCVINSDSGRRIGDRMTFRESARDTDPGATAVAPGGLITADEPETPGALGEDAEETPRPEPLEAGASPRGEDPVRLYLKEIGKVPLLTAAQEVQIGRRIEVGQIALRRTLAGIPVAVTTLLEVGDKLRRGEIPADDVIVLAEGGELDAKELRPVLLAFGRLRRLERSDRTVRQAKRELMEANLRLVVSVAKRYLGSDLTLLDLVQEGNIGLMKAVDRFQYRRGFKFSTYATWWIRQAITRVIPDPSRTIRIPVHMVETLNRISRVNRGLVNEMGREATPEELAQRTGVPAKKVRLILESSRKPLSLETPIGEDSELGDFLEDKSAGSPNESLLNQDLTTQVERALSTLSPKEKEILRLRFGIGEEGEHTLEEVGRRFAVTRERIRQIEAKALRKLRHPLRGRNLRA